MASFMHTSLAAAALLAAFSSAAAFAQKLLQSRGISGRTLGMVDDLAKISTGPRDLLYLLSHRRAFPALGRAALCGPLGEPSASANEKSCWRT
jgi:hypothetical protein